MIKSVIQRVLFTLLVALSCHADTTDNELSKLSTELGRSSLHDFNQVVASNGWKAPFIPSQWYVVREALPEAKARGEQARAFGKDLAQCLDAWAEQLAYESNTVHNLEMTTDLLDLVDWVASVPLWFHNRQGDRHTINPSISQVPRPMSQVVSTGGNISACA